MALRFSFVCVRRFSVAALFAAAAGCATAPPQQAAFSQNLALCPGGGIANAPETHGSLRVAGYTPFTDIRGVHLARTPAAACVSSGFGPRNGGAGAFHHGVDLYTGRPRAVAAAGDGVVAFAGSQRGYGKTVEIRHGNGVSTRYAHLSSFASGLKPGRRVRSGDIIAATGSTGNATAVHLHYEILVDGRRVNPLTAGG